MRAHLIAYGTSSAPGLYILLQNRTQSTVKNKNIEIKYKDKYSIPVTKIQLQCNYVSTPII